MYFDFREKIWIAADQSGIDICSFKISDLCEQENSNSISVRPKILRFGYAWWNVAAD
jgi:hypothetical protein